MGLVTGSLSARRAQYITTAAFTAIGDMRIDTSRYAACTDAESVLRALLADESFVKGVKGYVDRARPDRLARLAVAGVGVHSPDALRHIPRMKECAPLWNDTWLHPDESGASLLSRIATAALVAAMAHAIFLKSRPK